MVRVPNGTKNLLKQLAKKRQSNVSEVCREILEQALHLEFSAEQHALQRFETLQAEHQEMMSELRKLAERSEMNHQISSGVLAYVASREMAPKRGTEEEVLDQTMHTSLYAIAFGKQVNERHQRDILDKD